VTKVLISATVSLDGFIAREDDSVGPLFDWYESGDVEASLADPDRVFHLTSASAEYLRTKLGGIRATVIGRRLFALTNGWNGVPATGEHVFVVTHEPPTNWPYPDAPYTFVTGGVEAAISQARAFAGDGDIAVTAGEVGGQALAAGLVDEVHLCLAPVLLGRGRPFFGAARRGEALLENPEVIEGDRVVHLMYETRRRRCR
jgi:dihydrofolate reductase